jgi:hypothetical protein
MVNTINKLEKRVMKKLAAFIIEDRFFEDFGKICSEHFKHLPKDTDLFIYTSEENKEKYTEQLKKYKITPSFPEYNKDAPIPTSIKYIPGLSQMLEDKRMKSINKEIKAELKELNKSGFKIYINKNCYFCKRDGIYKSTDKICICSTCSPSNNKLLKQNINFEIKKALEDCLYCDLPFINTGKKSCELCRNCKKIVKINFCKMCKSQFVLGINKKDLYCDVCDENLINCFDCKRELLKQQSQNLRCYKCNHRHINNLILINCQYCDVEIEVSEKDKWRTSCRN